MFSSFLRDSPLTPSAALWAGWLDGTRNFVCRSDLLAI